MRQTFWILIAFSAIGAALNPNELDEAVPTSIISRMMKQTLTLILYLVELLRVE